MRAEAPTKIGFRSLWCEFVPGQGDAFLRELKRELSPSHPMNGLELFPLGHSGAADDVLFGAEDGRVFQVHLTDSHHVEQLPLPRWQIYPSADDWIHWVMRPANEEFLGRAMMER